MKQALGRNDRCHCGSGKKYKHCCLGKDEVAERESRAAEAVAPKEAAEPEADETSSSTRDKAPPDKGKRHDTAQPWKNAGKSVRTAQKSTTRRRVGS